MAKSTRQAKKPGGSRARRATLYTLEVSLASGPLSRAFVSANPVVSRTIQIHGNQTLAELHRAIFEAFGRGTEQMYEFHVGRGPTNTRRKRYVLPGAVEMVEEGAQQPAGSVTETSLHALKLRPGQTFYYWFDFVADWWHRVHVRKVEDKTAGGNYPRVVEEVGANPPEQTDVVLDPESPTHNISGDSAADMSCLIGEMHLSKRAYEKAIEAFGRAIAVRPTADAYLGRARAYRGLADRDEQQARELG
jgi:hypothetical protein